MINMWFCIFDSADQIKKKKKQVLLSTCKNKDFVYYSTFRVLDGYESQDFFFHCQQQILSVFKFFNILYIIYNFK